MFKQGSIRKIRVKNFVTYSYTELIPGPSLNMLIGPNGTGKSTIVAAIILGLGGNPKVVGRGTKVSEYVKHECTEATIDIYLQGTEENEYIHITRSFDTQERNVWKLNNRKVKFKDITECVKQFNIQVDNLCQFLPQDRVQDFAKLNKKELLRETQVALCRRDLLDLQDELVERRARHVQLGRAVDQAEQRLQDARDANARLEGKVTNFNNKKRYLDQAAHVERKMAWVQYEEEREKLTTKKEDKQKATQLYERHKTTARPLEKQIGDAKKRIADFQAAGTNITRAVKNTELEVRQQLEESNKLKRSINDITNRMQTKLEEIAQSEQEIEATSANIEVMKVKQRELLDQCGNDELVKAKVGKITEEVRKLSRLLQTYDAKKESVMEARQSYSAQLRSKQHELTRLMDVKRQRLEKLRTMDNNVYQAVLWLRENRHLFKGEVLEPMMLEINVLDPRNAIYVENVVARRDYMAFTCTDKEDMNLLIRHLRQEKGLRVSVLHSGGGGRGEAGGAPASLPRIPIEQLRRFGFHTYVNSLFTAPAPIVHFLLRNYNIHNIPVGDAQVNRTFEKLPDSVRVFFSDKYRYSISYSKYSKEKITRQNEIHADGSMSISVDVFQLENLEGQVEDLKKNCEACARQIQEYDEQVVKINESVAALRGQLKGIQEIKQASEQIATRINSLQRRIVEMRSDVENRDNIKREADRKIQVVVRDAQKIQQSAAQSFARCCAQLARLELNSMKAEGARRRATLLEARAAEAVRAVKEAEELLATVQREYLAQLAQAKAALAKAKQLSGGATPDDEAFDVYRTEYDRLPADPVQLQMERDQLLSRIDCLNTADDGEMHEYEARLQEIAGLQEQMHTQGGEMHAVLDQMDALQERWLGPLRQLVATIASHFGQAFERMGCAGEVAVDTGENERDYGDYGLAVKVTFRDGEPLQQLDGVVQSGGERAVATAVFMLALQEMTPVPFRCVDEINQGMDPNNERRIFELLVDCTTQLDTAQYFLVTPKLVPNLRYVKGMMIHIIHNGPFIERDRKWMMSRLCNPQKVQIA